MAYGNPPNHGYGYYTPGFTSSANTVLYTGTTTTNPFWPAPLQLDTLLPVTDLDWLREQVDEVCDLAWAA